MTAEESPAPHEDSDRRFGLPDRYTRATQILIDSIGVLEKGLNRMLRRGELFHPTQTTSGGSRYNA